MSAKRKSCKHKLQKHYITKAFCQLNIKIVGKKDHYSKTKQNLYFISIKDEQTKYIYSELIKHAIKNLIIEFLKTQLKISEMLII